jgi:hypothetical protein
MRIKSLLYIAFGLFTLSCSDNDISDIGKDLFQTNQSYVGFYAQYQYTNGRVDKITLHGDGGDWQNTFLQITYLNDNSPEIALVEFYPESTDYSITDTLIYTGGNVSHIIRRTIENEITKPDDTTFFYYNQQSNLIEAHRNNKRLTFSNYQGTNFGNVKQYNNGQLFREITIKYDKGISPFSGLGYLNLVIFNDNYLEGFQYLTNNNIVEWTEVEYQGITLTDTYKIKIQYDQQARPRYTTLTRVGDNEFKLRSYYKYK